MPPSASPSTAEGSAGPGPRASPGRPPVIALVLDSITAQRLSRGMFRQFPANRDFRFVDIYRPLPDLMAKVASWRADVLVTRWTPGISDALRALKLPTVLIGGYATQPRTVCVGVDNVKVGELAAHHLLERGLRHFAFAGKAYPFVAMRELGFTQALQRANHGCEAHVSTGQAWDHYLEDLPHADENLARWVNALPKPVGIFCAQDTTGWQILQVCQSAGWRVPDEVAVVAANNDELTCGLANPPLSSVSIPWDKIGGEVALAAEHILAQRGRARTLHRAFMRVPPDGVVVRQSSHLLAVAQPALAQALLFIRENAHRPISVSDLLDRVPLSRRKLEQLFQHHLQRSPKAEITRVRIERAKDLLARTDQFIPRVAENCGYAYATRFSSAFKAATGLTPSDYRNQFRCEKTPRATGSKR